jgi:hypothetical protein
MKHRCQQTSNRVIRKGTATTTEQNCECNEIINLNTPENGKEKVRNHLLGEAMPARREVASVNLLYFSSLRNNSTARLLPSSPSSWSAVCQVGATSLL